MRAWLTRGPLPTTYVCRQWCLPDDVDLRQVIAGALTQLFDPVNWEQIDETAPTSEEMAEYYAALLSSQLDFERCCMFPGAIVYSPSDMLAPGWLPCDGRQVTQADYPELFGYIGYTFGGASGVFNLPDIQDKFIKTDGTDGEIGDEGGAKTVTLTTAQMPQHSHGLSQVALAQFTPQAYAGGEIPGTVVGVYPGGVPGTATDTTGGNGAHENQPVFITLKAVIYTGRCN